MVADCVCASAVWLELAVRVTDLLWEKKGALSGELQAMLVGQQF